MLLTLRKEVFVQVDVALTQPDFPTEADDYQQWVWESDLRETIDQIVREDRQDMYRQEYPIGNGPHECIGSFRLLSVEDDGWDSDEDDSVDFDFCASQCLFEVPKEQATTPQTPPKKQPHKPTS